MLTDQTLFHQFRLSHVSRQLSMIIEYMGQYIRFPSVTQ